MLPLTDIHTNFPVALRASAPQAFMAARGADRRIGTECAALVPRYAS